MPKVTIATFYCLPPFPPPSTSRWMSPALRVRQTCLVSPPPSLWSSRLTCSIRPLPRIRFRPEVTTKASQTHLSRSDNPKTDSVPGARTTCPQAPGPGASPSPSGEKTWQGEAPLPAGPNPTPGLSIRPPQQAAHHPRKAETWGSSPLPNFIDSVATISFRFLLCKVAGNSNRLAVLLLANENLVFRTSGSARQAVTPILRQSHLKPGPSPSTPLPRRPLAGPWQQPLPWSPCLLRSLPFGHFHTVPGTFQQPSRNHILRVSGVKPKPLVWHMSPRYPITCQVIPLGPRTGCSLCQGYLSSHFFPPAKSLGILQNPPSSDPTSSRLPALTLTAAYPPLWLITATPTRTMVP